MAKGFSLEIDPWVYRAKVQEYGGWTEEYIEKPHLSVKEEEALPANTRAELLLQLSSSRRLRRGWPGLPGERCDCATANRSLQAVPPKARQRQHRVTPVSSGRRRRELLGWQRFWRQHWRQSPKN